MDGCIHRYVIDVPLDVGSVGCAVLYGRGGWPAQSRSFTTSTCSLLAV
jgi:hypothetical protein